MKFKSGHTFIISTSRASVFFFILFDNGSALETFFTIVFYALSFVLFFIPSFLSFFLFLWIFIGHISYALVGFEKVAAARIELTLDKVMGLTSLQGLSPQRVTTVYHIMRLRASTRDRIRTCTPFRTMRFERTASTVPATLAKCGKPKGYRAFP